MVTWDGKEQQVLSKDWPEQMREGIASTEDEVEESGEEAVSSEPPSAEPRSVAPVLAGPER